MEIPPHPPFAKGGVRKSPRAPFSKGGYLKIPRFTERLQRNKIAENL